MFGQSCRDYCCPCIVSHAEMLGLIYPFVFGFHDPTRRFAVFSFLVDVVNANPVHQNQRLTKFRTGVHFHTFQFQLGILT